MSSTESQHHPDTSTEGLPALNEQRPAENSISSESDDIASPSTVRSGLSSVISTPESDAIGEDTSPITTMSNKEKLAAAVKVCRQFGANIGKTARLYGLSATTLGRHVKGNVKAKGGQCVFTPQQEQTIVNHLLKMSDWLVPMKRQDVEDYVQSLLDLSGKKVSRFRNNRPGKDWSYGFLKRHDKELAIRRSKLISPRKGLVTEDVVRQFFELLSLQLSGDDAIPPSRIMNYDETNLVNSAGQQYVIFRRSQKNNFQLSKSSKSGFSVMFAACADGTLMPPYVVYKSKRKNAAAAINPKWYEGCPPPLAQYDSSATGWFKMKQFERWFEMIVLPWAAKTPGQQKLVFGDNLSAHFSEKVMQLCRQHHVSFKCFPANTTHFMQPLDVAVFGPMKKKWKSILEAWKTKTAKSSTPFSRTEFTYRLKELIDVVSPQTILAGFKATGLVPFNVEEAIRHLPLHESNALDSSGAVLVEYLKDQTDIRRPPPSKKSQSRPPAGSDLQNVGINNCMNGLLDKVCNLDISDSTSNQQSGDAGLQDNETPISSKRNSDGIASTSKRGSYRKLKSVVSRKLEDEFQNLVPNLNWGPSGPPDQMKNAANAKPKRGRGRPRKLKTKSQGVKKTNVKQ